MPERARSSGFYAARLSAQNSFGYCAFHILNALLHPVQRDFLPACTVACHLVLTGISDTKEKLIVVMLSGRLTSKFAVKRVIRSSNSRSVFDSCRCVKSTNLAKGSLWISANSFRPCASARFQSRCMQTQKYSEPFDQTRPEMLCQDCQRTRSA